MSASVVCACPKIRGSKNVLLAISETSVGLSLFTFHWKVLPEQNI